MKTKLLFLSIFIMTAHYGVAQEFSVGPTDDAHFYFHASKTENLGSETLLRARFNTAGEFRTDIAVKFDISDCSFELPYDKVLLKLYGSDDGVVCPVRVLKVASTYANYDWTESTINGSLRPATTFDVDNIAEINLEGDYEEKYHEWDITTWVNTEKASGRNIINLHIRQMSVPGSNFNDPTFFHSKENESGNKPLIVIQKTSSSVRNAKESSNWAYVSNGKLIVNENDYLNQDISIYSLSGHLIRTIKANDQDKSVGDLNGLNIIKAGHRAMKLVF